MSRNYFCLFVEDEKKFYGYFKDIIEQKFECKHFKTFSGAYNFINTTEREINLFLFDVRIEYEQHVEIDELIELGMNKFPNAILRIYSAWGIDTVKDMLKPIFDHETDELIIEKTILETEYEEIFGEIITTLNKTN